MLTTGDKERAGWRKRVLMRAWWQLGAEYPVLKWTIVGEALFAMSHGSRGNAVLAVVPNGDGWIAIPSEEMGGKPSRKTIAGRADSPIWTARRMLNRRGFQKVPVVYTPSGAVLTDRG